jgi:O-Antigen ligase
MPLTQLLKNLAKSKRSIVNQPNAGNPYEAALRTSLLLCFLMLATVSAYIWSPLRVIAPLAAAGFLWVIFRFPIEVLGCLLAFMPVDYMAIELGKFSGLSYMTLVSACTKEIPLVLLLFIFWRRNGFKFLAPDWFILGVFALAAIKTVFEGTLLNLLADFQFLIPYFLGRVVLLTPEQQARWARSAVWIVGVLAVAGMSEIFIFGEVPRTVLYLATDSVTIDGRLSASFHGTGFSGIREASTMVGPPEFAALCMIALILWWVYYRNPLPGILVASGLVCSVTRSAWLGAAFAITILAFLTKETKRLAIYTGLALALFVASIPVLGLGEFLSTTQKGKDESAQSHQESILTGVNLIADYPLGGGNRRIGPRPGGSSTDTVIIENTYLAIGAEYGIPALLCFLAFVISASVKVWRKHSQLGYAALGILAGMGVVMTVLLMHIDRRLVCWAWFPVGLAVGSPPSRNSA